MQRAVQYGLAAPVDDDWAGGDSAIGRSDASPLLGAASGFRGARPHALGAVGREQSSDYAGLYRRRLLLRPRAETQAEGAYRADQLVVGRHVCRGLDLSRHDGQDAGPEKHRRRLCGAAVGLRAADAGLQRGRGESQIGRLNAAEAAGPRGRSRRHLPVSEQTRRPLQCHDRASAALRR